MNILESQPNKKSNLQTLEADFSLTKQELEDFKKLSKEEQEKQKQDKLVKLSDLHTKLDQAIQEAITTGELEEAKKLKWQLEKEIKDLEEQIKVTEISLKDEKIFQEIMEGKFNRTNELTFLPDEIAEYLSKHTPKEVHINLFNLKSISDIAAEHLSKFEGTLNLESLLSISDAAAESLSKHKGPLWIYRITSLSDTAAKHLSKYQGPLDLDVTSLSDVAVKSLSEHKGSLGFNFLTSISDTAAKYLSEHQGGLKLTGLTSLSDTAAEYLSKHQGEIEFDERNTIFQDKVDKFK